MARSRDRSSGTTVGGGPSFQEQPALSVEPAPSRIGRLRPWSKLSAAPWAPALLVLLVYGVWLLGVAGLGRDIRDFIHIGHRYAFETSAPLLFKEDPLYPYAVTTHGYDGQFSYYIAIDPTNARSHVDRPDYRYTRILYPMGARLLSLGNRELTPYMLVAINWLAIAGGTLLLALWLRRRELSPWLSLIYGLSPGLFVSLQRDLEEPLAYTLVLLAIYLYSFARRRRLLWSGLAFGLAALTRESTALFPAVLAVGLLFEQSPPACEPRSRWSRATLLLALSFGPFALYKAFLQYWTPNSPMFPPGLEPRLLPFSGIVTYWPWNADQIEVMIAVIIPALLCAAAGLWAVRKRAATVEIWLLLANVQLYVVMLNGLSYENIFGTSRIALGVVLAAVLCLPALDRYTSRNRWWLWLSAALWFVPWPALITFTDQPPGLSELFLDLSGVLTLFWILTVRQMVHVSKGTAC